MDRISSTLFQNFISSLSHEISAKLQYFNGSHEEEDVLDAWKGFPRRCPFYVKTLKFWTELGSRISLSLVKEMESWSLPPFLGMSTSKFASLNQEVVFSYLRLLESLWALISADLFFHLLQSCDHFSTADDAPVLWRNLLVAGKFACALPSREEENRAWYPVFARISILARVQWSAVFGLLSSMGAGYAHEGERFGVAKKDAWSQAGFFRFFSTALFPSMNAAEYSVIEAYSMALLCGSLRLPVNADSRMSMRVVILLSKILSAHPHPAGNGVSAVLLKTLDLLMLQFDFPKLLKLSSTQRIPRTSAAQWELFFEETVVQRVFRPAETLAKFERLKPAALHLMCTVLYLSPDAFRKQHFAKFMQHRVFRHLNEPKKLRHSIQIVLHAVRLACGKRREKPGWNAFDVIRAGDLGVDLGNDATEFLDLCFAEVFERSKSRVMNSVPVLGRMTGLLRPYRSAQWGEDTAQEFTPPVEDLRTPVLSLLLEMARNSPSLLVDRILPSLLQVEDVYKATPVSVRKALLGLELINQVLSACRMDDRTASKVEEICVSCEVVLDTLGSSQHPLTPTRIHVRRCGVDGNDLTGFTLNQEFCWAEEDIAATCPVASFDTFHYHTAETFHTVAEEMPCAWTLSLSGGDPTRSIHTLNEGRTGDINRSVQEVLNRSKQHGLKPDRVVHTLAVAYEAFPALAMLGMTTKISSVAQRLTGLLTHVDWGVATSASHALQRMILCADDELQRALVISALVDFVEQRVFKRLEAPLTSQVCCLQTVLQQLLLLLDIWHAQRKLAPLPSDGTEQIVREEWNVRIPAITTALNVYPVEAFHVAGKRIVRLITAIVRSFPFAVEWALDVIVNTNRYEDEKSNAASGDNRDNGYNWRSIPSYDADPLLAALRNLKAKNSFVAAVVEKFVGEWQGKLDLMTRHALGAQPPDADEAGLLLRLHWRVLVSIVCLNESDIDQGILFQCWDLAVDCRQTFISTAAAAAGPSAESFIRRLMNGMETLVGVAATKANVHVYVQLLLEWHSAQEIQKDSAASTDDAGHRFLAKILKRGGHKAAAAAAAESVEIEEKRFSVRIEAMVLLRNVIERLEYQIPAKHVAETMKSVEKMVAQMNVDTLQAAGVTLAQAFADLLIAVGSWLYRYITASSLNRSIVELHEQADKLWKRAERRKAWRLLQRLSGFSDIPVGFQKCDGEEGDLAVRGSMKKLRITAREYERLQRGVAQAAGSLLTLGPVSLGNVPAPPESWHWAWFYSEWEKRKEEEDLVVDTQARGLFASYLLAHWRVGDMETWISFQAYLEEYYKNEEAGNAAEAAVVFHAITSSLCLSAQAEKKIDEHCWTGPNAAIVAKCVFLGLVQVRASTSIVLRQQAFVMLQRILGDAAALGRFAEVMDDVWLIRKNAEQIAVNVFKSCSRDVRRCVYDELCCRLPQLCVAGRALEAVTAMLPLLQSHSLPSKRNTAAGVSVEDEDQDTCRLPLPALWSSFHQCAGTMEQAAMTKLAVFVLSNMASRREAVGTLLGFLVEQQAEGEDDASGFTLAADLLVKCSVHLLDTFPNEVLDTLVPLLDINPMRGFEDGGWQACALSRQRRTCIQYGRIPGEASFVQALSCCLKRDPRLLLTAIPVLTAYCLCHPHQQDSSNGAGEINEVDASSPTTVFVRAVDKAIDLHGHHPSTFQDEAKATLQPGEGNKSLATPLIGAFSRLCTLLNSKEELPQNLCRMLLIRLVLAEDDDMRLRALNATLQLRRVFRCASDTTEDWVRVEALFILLVLEHACLSRNERLLHGCLRFLHDLHALCRHFAQDAGYLAVAVGCIVTLLDSSRTVSEWKLPDATYQLLVHFYINAVLDDGFRDYIPPVLTVKRLVQAQIEEVQSFEEVSGLQLTQKMLRVGRLHEEYAGYGVVIVYVAALSCGEQFHVLKEAVGSLGTECFGLEEEVEPIIVVIERLMERYGSSVLKDVLQLSCACGIPRLSSAWMESVFQIAIAMVQLESSSALLPVFQFSLDLQARQDLARYDLDWLHTRETSKQFNDIYTENGELETQEPNAAEDTEEDYDVVQLIHERVETERKALRSQLGYTDEEEKDMDTDVDIDIDTDEPLEGKLDQSMNEIFITSRKKAKKKEREAGACKRKETRAGKPREVMASGTSTFEQVRVSSGSEPIELSYTAVALAQHCIPTPYEVCAAECVNVLEENEIIKLLRHEVISQALMSFMRAHRLNTTWLEFARACLLFSNSPTKERADGITRRFIKLDALDTLPLDRKLRSMILESKKVDRTLFDDVLVKAIDYVKEHAYSDFLRSRFFTDLVNS